jgi:ribosomal protein L5
MRKLKSQILDLDLLIKLPNIHPYDVLEFNKAVLHINHNPAVSNKLSLLPAISSVLDFTNQYPAVLSANSSFASFNVRKGMQLSLLSTVRNLNLRDLYYKFMFFIFPDKLNSSDSNSIFRSLPVSGNFHIGISLFPKISGNLIFVLNSKSGKFLSNDYNHNVSKFKRIVFSF